jgi:peptidylprolyl isomerase
VAGGYRQSMANNEKPQVDVPSDQPPSYQLELDDMVVGDGEEAVSGRVVEVHYVGVSWQTGKQFDASWDRGDTFKFGLGKGQVIPGWDQGVAGMKVGGRRRITIPPNLAYGKRGAGGVIGPDETLVFVVDLIAVRCAHELGDDERGGQDRHVGAGGDSRGLGERRAGPLVAPLRAVTPDRERRQLGQEQEQRDLPDPRRQARHAGDQP